MRTNFHRHVQLHSRAHDVPCVDKGVPELARRIDAPAQPHTTHRTLIDKDLMLTTISIDSLLHCLRSPRTPPSSSSG